MKLNEREQRLLHLDITKVEDMPGAPQLDSNKRENRRGTWKKDKADKGLLLRGHTYSIRYADPTAKNGMRVEAIGPSKAFAKKMLEKRKTEQREGRFFPAAIAKRTTWDEIIDDAERTTEKKHQLKFAGARRFADFRWRVIRPWFSGRLARTITAAEIDTKLNERAKTGATKNQYRLAVSKAYKLAIRAKKLIENPASEIDLIKLNNNRIRYLNQYDKHEEEKLRLSMRKLYPQREAEFDLAQYSGMRFAEQFGAYWRDVDFERRLLTVQVAKSGTKEYVVLNSRALAALAALRSRFSADADVSDEHVCPTRAWEHRTSWDEIKKDAKVKDLRWHDLRHTYASQLAMANVNILTIQKLMRHQTLTMTLRYAHLAPSRLHEDAEAICANASVTKSVTTLSSEIQRLN